MRDKVFISYCHADSEFLRRVMQHFKPLERNGYLQYWSDVKIKASQDWRDEIRNALKQSAISVLLISADFLASDFIAFEELPDLLENTQVFPILVHPCYLEKEKWLSKIQFVNDLARPLSGMTKTEQEATYASLTKEVTESIQAIAQTQDPDYLLYNDGIATFVELMAPPSTYQNKRRQSTSDNSPNMPNFLNREVLDYYMQDLIASPNIVQNYWVYEYQHIDVLDFMLPADLVLSAYPTGAQIIDNLKTLFSAHGWEGDGEIRFMWFPPFLNIGMEDTWGTLAFFVKQYNNGIAFIACPESIPYLIQQNTLYPDKDGYYITRVTEERHIKSGLYRCLKISGLLLADQAPLKDETHWLFFYSNQFQNIKIGDIVRFKPKRPPLPLRDFPDIAHTRNIYVEKLEKIM